MKRILLKCFYLPLMGLVFAISGSIASAQLASTNIVFTFDTGDQTTPFVYGTNTTFPVFTHWFGDVVNTFTWDGEQDAASNVLSGSFKLTEDWGPTQLVNDQYAANFLWNLMATGQGGGGSPTVNMSLYAFVDLDIKIDPSSATNNNGNYGNLLLIANINFGQIVLGSYTIPQSATNWTHVQIAIPAGLGLSWGPAFQKQGFGANRPNGTVTMWVDNFQYTSVPAAPAILTQPADQEVFTGKNINMSVLGVGGQPFSYQWYQGATALVDGPTGTGSDITGSTNISMKVSNVSATDTGYTVVITNDFGSVTSRVASVALISPATAGTYAQAVIASGPVAFYELNETKEPSTLPAAYDHIGGFAGSYASSVTNGFHGIAGPRYSGFPSTNAAIFLAPNGNGNRRILLPALNLNTNTVTFTAWIRPVQYRNNAGIVFCRSGTTTSGFIFNGAAATVGDPREGNLGYNWNDNANTYNWQTSGLKPPLNEWSFVALVITPDDGTIYLMNASQGISTPAVNFVANAVEPFAGETRIGNDSNNDNRSFRGSIDAVAIYNRALTAEELQELYFAGGLGPTLTTDGATLNWNLLGSATATLLQSTNLVGPWVPTPDAPVSGFTLPLTEPEMFYRLSVP